MRTSSESNKASFVERVRSARSGLNEALSGLSEEQLTREGTIGDWSVKDMLAHLAAWTGEAAMGVERALRGEAVGPLVTGSVDEWNARRVEERRRLPLVDIVQEFNETYDRLLAALEAAPEDAIPLGPGGWDESARLWWLTEHDREHLDVLRGYRAQLEGQGDG